MSWSIRSIPACAGEPGAGRTDGRRVQVYPRVCGGTWRWRLRRAKTRGLSPRVRGNRECGEREGRAVRSIPACAGEPCRRSPAPSSAAVYPRVCGGTPGDTHGKGTAGGLSPRVRGNLGVRVRNPSPLGSIPACAGEPVYPRPRGGNARVYPRVCGGTRVVMILLHTLYGLSPRVRGNPSKPGVDRTSAGSIPACAGEPALPSTTIPVLRVYPRVCGGTDDQNGARFKSNGLSPRVRGNHARAESSCRARGSIPACAGEPYRTSSKPCRESVYPRVCGGTAFTSAHSRHAHGLSPRVRGNPYRCRLRD